jgi:hypothetical protein
MALVLALAGCGNGIGFGSGGGGLFGGGGGLFGRDRTPPSAAMTPGEDTPRPEAREDGAAASAPETAGDGLVLGFAVASLGDASIPGMWIETPLVSAEGPGRVVGPDGRTVAVTLRPSGGGPGSGSRLSLEAMQALGLDLSSLPTVTVISDA